MDDEQLQQLNSGGGSIVPGIIGLLIAVVVIAGLWKTFVKAGKPGWAVLVPIYNAVVLLQIAGKPIWWLLLFLIPFVGFVMAIITAISLAGRFGKGAGFGVGLALLPFIFYPLLGFGDATYLGDSESSASLQGAGRV